MFGAIRAFSLSFDEFFSTYFLIINIDVATIGAAPPGKKPLPFN